MKVLVVVDMQKDFIDGALGTAEAQAIVPNVKAKIEQAISNGDFIIYTRDSHFSDYLSTREGRALPVKHCLYGSEGWRVPDELLPPGDYLNWRYINKYTFGSTDLVELIGHHWRDSTKNKVSDSLDVEMIGVCTDICVVSNALLLMADISLSVNLTVDASCCAGVTPEKHKAALEVMKSCQINVINEGE